jgi:hypothetical protein
MLIRFDRRDFDPRPLLESLAGRENVALDSDAPRFTRNGSAIRCTLRYSAALDPNEMTRRLSASGRRTCGVTWAAHRGFLMRLFDTFPEAVVVSALATYRGKADFLAKYPATANHNAGSRMHPVRFADL